MNILIIGNGFDLAHGLPTKYEHFLKYIKAFERFKLSCIEANREAVNDENKNYIIHFSNMYEQKKETFREIDTLILNNAWIDYFLNRKTDESDGWIDFESEISRIIQALDDARLTISREINEGNETGKMTHQQRTILAPIWGKTGKDFDMISFSGKSIPRKKTQLLIDLNRLTRCLELYLENFVEITEPKVKLPDIKNISINYVLSFNYTHTYKSLYHRGTVNETQYDYIHGEIKPDSRLETCNLILGIDEYLEGNAKNMDNEFIQFKKFYQRIFKKTGCKYVDWQKAATQSASSNDIFLHEIYIIGHSLDITDKDILSRLINMRNTKTTIFYHNQIALANQISNLVKILGEDALISKIHGDNASIILQQQQYPVPI